MLCYFHLCQNLWKNIQNKNLVTRYVESANVRKNFKLLKCLSFVPAKDVIFAFKENCGLCDPEFKPMLTYFEEFYIGVMVNKSTRRSPMFPIKMWNSYSRALEDLDTVNNSLESWHKVFEMDCKKHPTINKVIQHFTVFIRI